MKPLLFLVVIALASTVCCKKTDSEDYTSKMGGTRIWQHYGSTHRYGYPDTLFFTSTETFPITIINGTTISVMNIYLNFVSKDVQNGIMIFNHKDPTATFYQLTYYYNADSMQYHSDYYGASSFSINDYFSP